MEIGKSIYRKNSENLILKSTLWKVVVDIYKKEKKIDISNYLISIQVRGSTFFIKTNKPIINYELIQYQGTIMNLFENKIKKMGIPIQNIILKFL